MSNHPAPPHEIRDDRKLVSLIASMERDGWVGRPVLVIDSGADQAWTGSHRIAAAESTGTEIPVLRIAPDWERWGEAIEACAPDQDDRLRLLREMSAEPQTVEGDIHEAVRLMEAEIAANDAEAA